MMNTQYLTLILRLRLDDSSVQEPTGEIVTGSLQQAGRQDIRYFDSLEKLQQTLQYLIGSLSLKELNDGKSE